MSYYCYESNKDLVKSDSDMLQYVPKRHLTSELCKIAVENCWINLRWVPKSLITVQLCLIALREAPYALCLIPKRLLTKEVCEFAIFVHSPNAFIYREFNRVLSVFQKKIKQKLF